MKPTTKAPDNPDDRRVALTLKIDHKTFVRLSTPRAKERRTANEILTELLENYLNKHGVRNSTEPRFSCEMNGTV